MAKKVKIAKKVNKAKPAAQASGGKNYAGFLVRFGAALIDGVIAIILGLIIPMIGSFVVLAINVYLIQKEGYSIGKKVLNLRIIKEDGKKPTLVDAIIREVVAKNIGVLLISFGIPLSLGLIGIPLVILGGIYVLAQILLIIFDSKKQSVHDKIAKTYVVKV